jgi:hypothetical protein
VVSGTLPSWGTSCRGCWTARCVGVVRPGVSLDT